MNKGFMNYSCNNIYAESKQTSSRKSYSSPKSHMNKKEPRSLERESRPSSDVQSPKDRVKTATNKNPSSDIVAKAVNKIKSVFQKSGRPPSLMNIGANCYLNSAIQGISSCNKFVNDIAILHESEYLQLKDLQRKGNLEKLIIFQQLIKILHGGHVSYLEISSNSIFKNWNKPGQQDSYELLAYVINQVYNDIRSHLETHKLLSRNIQEWLKVPLPLRMLIEYKIKCGCGLLVEAPLQSDLALHVPMSSNTKKSLQELVDDFFENDIIEDYICDRKDCDGKNATRHTKLRLPLPRTICIHLQRTFWDGRKMLKIRERIKFDQMLIIKSQFCSMGVNRNFNTDSEKREEENDADLQGEEESERNNRQLDSDKLKSKISDPNRGKRISNDEDIASRNRKDSKNKETRLISDDPSIMDKEYSLCSVIVHYGSVYGGHYVCYKLVEDQWYLTDDSSIRTVKDDQVFACEAYILFYEEL